MKKKNVLGYAGTRTTALTILLQNTGLLVELATDCATADSILPRAVIGYCHYYWERGLNKEFY